jgi:hypothetical protein
VPDAFPLSKVCYTDDDHVALTHQFFNKTMANFLRSPKVRLILMNPAG